MNMRAGPSDDVSRAGAAAEITRTRTQGSTVAEAERDRVVEAMKNGASRYSIKPFSPSATAAKLKEFLSETST